MTGRAHRGHRSVLCPFGTALERLAQGGDAPASRGAGESSEWDRWRRTLHRLGRAATAHDLGSESVYLVEELVATAWSLGERQRLALALLALALGAAERQGSTRLPLGGGSGGPLAAIVSDLCRAAGLEVDLRQVLRDIARLADLSGTAALDSLIGRPEDGRPLVSAAGAIASHRLYHCEARLIERLAPRLRGGARSPDAGAEAGAAAATTAAAGPAIAGPESGQLPADRAAKLAREDAGCPLPAAGRRSRAANSRPDAEPSRPGADPCPTIAEADARPAPVCSSPTWRWPAIPCAGLAGVDAWPAADLSAALADVDARPAAPGGRPVTLSGEQRRAVLLAASRSLAVVSGGPGTGKTAICAALCRVLVRNGIAPAAIAMAAPTGKAAQRLTWSVSSALAALARPSDEDRRLAAELPEARTLHRLLGYHPATGRFRHHRQFPVPAAVVIVDEASMVDLELMERLARALAPQTRLVLFGDADQLPSVEAGAVLRDLAACGEESGFACRLEHSFRMDPAHPDGRAILAAAQAVRAGRAGDLLAPELARTGPADLAYRGVERIDRPPDPARLGHMVDAWYRARIAAGGRTAELARRTYRFAGGAPVDEDAADLSALASTYDRCRVLAVTRRQPGGASMLNELFHRRAGAELGARPGDLLPGEPVVMRENDYGRGLFNGDSGVVVRVQEAGHAPELRAVFAQPDSWLSFPVAALRPRLERCFASTVHQSQGSEHDHVAVVLPATDIPLLSRELLYTALTRARHSVTILGHPDVLRAGVRRQVGRFSGLAAGLTSS